MNAKKYTRGQIWHWQDPIFGDKSDGEKIIDGESTVRCSRYVLIVENEPMTDSVLVVPLSTKYNRTSDYRIPITNLTSYESFSYIKADRVFPVSARQLDSYICTVDDETMKLVEGVLISLLCPTVYNDPDTAEILINKGLPMDTISEDRYVDMETKTGIYAIIGNFIKKHIRTGINQSIDSATLYEAYCVYCRMHGYIPPEKHSTFLDIFCTLMKISRDTSGKYEREFHNVRVVGIDVHSEERAVPTPSPAKKPEEKSTPKKKWDIDKRASFMKYVSEHTVKETAEHFGLSENSVYKYRKQFAALDGIPTQDTVTVSEDASESISNGDVMRSVRQIISDVSNYIKNEMIDAGIASYGNDKTSEGKDDFYKQISAAIYYSLMEYLEIKEQARTKMWYHSCPDVLTHMNGYLSIEALHEMMNTMTPYQIRPKVRSREGGIPQSWIQYLRNQLSNRLNINPDNIEVIISMIQSVYCLPDAA